MFKTLFKIFFGGALGLSLLTQPVQAAPILIQLLNPGFTSGLSHWQTYHTGATGKVTTYKGSPALKIIPTGSSNAQHTFRMLQTVSLVGGQSYQLRGYFAATGSPVLTILPIASKGGTPRTYGTEVDLFGVYGGQFSGRYKQVSETFTARVTDQYRVSLN